MQHAAHLYEAEGRVCSRLSAIVKLSGLGQIPDYDEPVVLHATNPTVEQFCNRLHKGESPDCDSSSIPFTLSTGIMPLFKYAWVWGSSVRHQPQKVGKDHILADEDIIQIVKRV